MHRIVTKTAIGIFLIVLHYLILYLLLIEVNINNFTTVIEIFFDFFISHLYDIFIYRNDSLHYKSIFF